MLTKKIALLTILSIVILNGCATKCCPPPRGLSNPEASLSEASYNISRSIVSLAESAQAARPLPCLEPPPDPASYCMAFPTSVDWSGPIEPLVKEIARAADYRVRVVGSRPAIPVLVTVYAKNTMLGDVLRDVGYQAGRRAAVVVFPDSRVIELRYAPN